MKAVNLLPREPKRARSVSEEQLPLVAGVAVLAVVVLALGGMFLLNSSKVAAAQHELDTAKAQLAATPVPPADPNALPTPGAVTATQQPLFASVSTALSQRIAWDRVLREFSLVLPNDVWVTSLALTNPGAARSTTGLVLQGSTYSYESVARLLSRLSLVPDLTGVTLGSSSRAGNLVTFSISAGIKGAAPPAAPAVTPPPTTTTGASS